MDSQLNAGKVNGDYKAKDDSMKMYLAKVKEAMAKFHLVAQLENAQADALSRLASSAISDEPRNIMWEVLPCPNINAFIGGVNQTDSWMDSYISFLRDYILTPKAKWF